MRRCLELLGLATLPGLFQLLLREERADVHGVAQLHVRQFAGHGDGCVPAARTASVTSQPATCWKFKAAKYRNSGTDL